MLEELTVVLMNGRVRELLSRLAETLSVDIAERDDVLARDAAQIGGTATVDADDAQVQAFAGGRPNCRSLLPGE